MTAAGSPHSETLGSKPARRLPEAYRCPPRLSSVPSAKASTIRPCRQPHTRGTRKTKRTPDDRSSTLCDHKTIKQQPDPQQEGTRSKYISTSRPQPYNNGMVRSRPLSSSQTTTPHHNQPTPHGDSRPRRAPVRRPPPGAVAAREPNSMPVPAPNGAQRPFHASTPGTRRDDPRDTMPGTKMIFSVERR